jgi:hypothetical protein
VVRRVQEVHPEMDKVALRVRRVQVVRAAHLPVGLVVEDPALGAAERAGAA